MRLVVALGGNALLQRGESPDAVIQEAHVASAASALAPLIARHDVILTHGNGPQVGVLAVESADDRSLSVPYPLDVLVAQTQGMIGYWLVQAVGRAAPERTVTCVLTRTLVDAGDPAFSHPTKPVGRVYDRAGAAAAARVRGWDVASDGGAWRRVVASPEPVAILELDQIRRLAGAGAVVICAGGGGVPVTRDLDGELRGVEAVVDKDLTAALLAEAVDADALLILTDVPAVEEGFGTPDARPLRRATVAELAGRSFAEGSMGPKVLAACRFAQATGRPAAIGRLDDAELLLSGQAGTTVSLS